MTGHRAGLAFKGKHPSIAGIIPSSKYEHVAPSLQNTSYCVIFKFNAVDIAAFACQLYFPARLACLDMLINIGFQLIAILKINLQFANANIMVFHLET